MDDRSENDGGLAAPAAWRPLNRSQRRVAGVLVEKAKTVPDAYPMTLNGIVTASNQKSNRDPQMSLQDHQVEQTLEELRGMGAVIEVHGGGRVAKYKHCMYEWLGVDKVELAVMAELLLRGAQTLGELRGRVARMEPVPDLAHLQPLVQGLQQRGLVQSLTPPGRGQVVSHALYEAREQAALAGQFTGAAAQQVVVAASTASPPAASPPAASPSVERSTVPASGTETVETASNDLQALKQIVNDLVQRVAVLERRLGERID